jgi:hypothetical protein
LRTLCTGLPPHLLLATRAVCTGAFVSYGATYASPYVSAL